MGGSLKDGLCAKTCGLCGKGMKDAEPCNVFDGASSSDTYPCYCGNIACRDGEICNAAANECTPPVQAEPKTTAPKKPVDPNADPDLLWVHPSGAPPELPPLYAVPKR